MRLIDADALVKALNESGVPYRADVQEVLDAQPTIDVVPVLRCKDCKHYEDDPLGMGFGHCELKEELALAFDRVCADGERKDDEID